MRIKRDRMLRICLVLSHFCFLFFVSNEINNEIFLKFCLFKNKNIVKHAFNITNIIHAYI